MEEQNSDYVKEATDTVGTLPSVGPPQILQVFCVDGRSGEIVNGSVVKTVCDCVCVSVDVAMNVFLKRSLIKFILKITNYCIKMYCI